jgi:tRNA 5-methylaminomethyl-2-thiouridine biosynthesis bifunctional protein
MTTVRLPDFRRWSPGALALRAVLLVAGAGGLVVAGWGGGYPLVAVVIGALGLLAAGLRPEGAGPAVVVGAAAAGWVLRYGMDQASVAGTVLLALALAVHHQAAALAAAVPVTARVDPAVPVRFARHGAVVLALSAAVAVLLLGPPRPAGSSALELLGIIAVVVVVTVPVLLSRSGSR